MGFKIRYKGDKKLSATLIKKSKLINKVDDDLGKSAFKVERDAKIGAPVNKGILRNSINTSKLKFLKWKVADGVNYGKFQEFGTRFLAGKHFMQKAVKNNSRAIANSIAKIYK